MTNKFKKKLLSGIVVMLLGGAVYYSTMIDLTLDITFLKIVGVSLVGLGTVIIIGE